MKKIGIVAAILQEFAPLCEKLGNPTFEERVGVFTIKKYDYDGKEIYLANSSIGEIMAASCTQYLITKYGVELILNYGLAGSLSNAELGKTLLVKGVVHYDYDTNILDGNEVGKYDIFDSVIVETDEPMRKLVKQIYPNIEEAVCASADKFVADAKVKTYLNQTFGANVCEMESAGVLFASKNNGVPQIIIKVISDSGDNAQEFYDYVNSKNIEYVNFISELIKKL